MLLAIVLWHKKGTVLHQSHHLEHQVVGVLAFNTVKVHFLDRFPGLQKTNLVLDVCSAKRLFCTIHQPKLPGPSTLARSIFTRLLSKRAAGSQNRLRAYYAGPRVSTSKWNVEIVGNTFRGAESPSSILSNRLWAYFLLCLLRLFEVNGLVAGDLLYYRQHKFPPDF